MCSNPQVFIYNWHVINATWIHMTGAVIVKHMSHIFVLNTRSSKAHSYGSDDIFPLERLYFLSLNLWEREREREGCTHERLICMSAPLSRQRGRPAERAWGGGEGEHSSSAFQKIADWLPPASAREPGSRQRTFLPLIAADETLMLPLSFPAPGTCTLLTSKPQQCVLWPTPACQTWAGLRSDCSVLNITKKLCFLIQCM